MVVTVATQPVLEKAQGSWHPSGYHGHFRGKPRGDFINEYRYLAKPLPPQEFLRRSRERPDSHAFSEHDNREAFLRPELYAPKRGEAGAKTEIEKDLFDATVFSNGLGKRKITSSVLKSDPRLMHWIPHAKEIAASGAPQSEYINNFSRAKGELFVARPKTTFDDDYNQYTSMYRYVYGFDNPNKNRIDAMANDVILSCTGGANAGIQKQEKCYDSVGHCLSWRMPHDWNHGRQSALNRSKISMPGVSRSKTTTNMAMMNESLQPQATFVQSVSHPPPPPPPHSEPQMTRASRAFRSKSIVFTSVM